MRKTDMYPVSLHFTGQEKSLLEFAACESHLTPEDFVYWAAMRAAKLAASQQETVVFTASEAQKYIEALDRRFEPNPKLKEAMDLATQVETKGSFS